MPRYALKIEYNGGGYAGWQRQKNVQTVQGRLEMAIAQLDPKANGLVGAGRTDAGVHAWGQVAHCDFAKDLAPARVSGALNYFLRGSGIAVVRCAVVGDNWHARFDATARRYIFRLVAREAPLTHDAGLIWRINHRLDPVMMQQAAAFLIGQHDFTTFRSTICQAQSPIKTLDSLEIFTYAYPEGVEYRFDIRARSFLHNQVRSIVGTLERVGAGAWSAVQVQEALKAADRTACGPVCPPDGLYLRSVCYPDDPFATAPKQ